MQEFLVLLAVVTAGSLLSLVGGLYLIYGKHGTTSLQKAAVPFAAGALLAAAFLDLLPEAIELDEPAKITMAALIGFLGFFVLERSMGWFHHHHDESDHGGRSQTTSLIIIGDVLHNFIDGLAIGAAFVVSPVIGIITTFAVAAHEIPQEIGDFGLLLSKGMKKRRVVLVNVVSAVVTVVAAALIYLMGEALVIDQGILLAVTAGFFIYIAASDIIPTIHAEKKRRTATLQTIVLIAGVVIVGVSSALAHSVIHGSESHSEQHEHDSEVHADNH